MEERALRRLLAGETHRVNQGVVPDPVPLREAVRSGGPGARTRSGGWHAFDAAEVARLQVRLSPLVATLVAVPLRFWVDHRDPTVCSVTDETTREALVQLGLHVAPLRQGRAWLSLPRAQAFARDWPTLVQFVRL